MIAVIQRVTSASVEVNGKVFSSIGPGYLVLLGIKKGDGEENAISLAKKIIDLRIFQDSAGKMNLGLRDIGGEVMVISQFTLCTDDSKSGNRPSFTMAEESGRANELYKFIVNMMKSCYEPDKIKTGEFAADMKVALVNDGPVTIVLDK